MKKIIFFSIGLLLISTGCAIKSNILSSIAKRDYKYQINIIKSEVNTGTIELIINKNPISMEELLAQPKIKFEKEINRGKEKITMLDGVIATASKNWYLFVNEQLIRFDDLTKISIKPEDKIQWRYEPVF